MPDGDEGRGSRGPPHRVHARRRRVLGCPAQGRLVRRHQEAPRLALRPGDRQQRPRRRARPGRLGAARPRTACCCAGSRKGCGPSIPTHQTFTRLRDVPGEPASNRNNDACTDTRGRVWLGTMDDGEKADTGRFYVFDKGQVTPAGPDHVSITNGPAVSPDGKTIYFTDTLGQKILVADLRDDGSLGPARLFADTQGAVPSRLSRRAGMRRRGLPVERALRRRPHRPLHARRPARYDGADADLQPDQAVLRRRGHEDRLTSPAHAPG